MLRLYDLCGKNNIRFSPSCWSVKLCLMYKEINFETIPVGFSEKHKIAFTNQKLVPIIRSKDHFIFDSWNIINWLEENLDKVNGSLKTINPTDITATKPKAVNG